jgi:hypothetical protein
MYDVEMCFVIGIPNVGRFSIPFKLPGKYLLAALLGLVPGCAPLLPKTLMTSPWSASP